MAEVINERNHHLLNNNGMNIAHLQHVDAISNGYNNAHFVQMPYDNQAAYEDSGDVEQDGNVPLSSKGEPKGPPQACLFVASLAPETDEDKLKDQFAVFGQVLKVKLLKDKSSRPYAFVQFQNIEDADSALQSPNGHVVDGRKLRVERAKVNRTLFLAKLSRTMANQELRNVTEEYGPVENVTIIKNHQTNKSKGCGFVKFVFREDAMDAFNGLKSKMKKWVVEWATSANDPDMLGVDKCSVFVGGLNPNSVTRENLEAKFAQYGKLETVTLINPLAATGKSDLVSEDPVQEKTDPKSEALDSPIQPATEESDEATDKNTTESSIKTKKAPSERTAFAFLRFIDPVAAATAIENENGSEWLERRIRVQYCETPEMKYRKRMNKYLMSYPGPMNQPYYVYNPQMTNAMYMVPAVNFAYNPPTAAFPAPQNVGPAVPPQAPSVPTQAPAAYKYPQTYPTTPYTNTYNPQVNWQYPYWMYQQYYAYAALQAQAAEGSPDANHMPIDHHQQMNYFAQVNGTDERQMNTLTEALNNVNINAQPRTF
eukprot:TRINITY_DN6684_c0_g1_i1.p1 TRINITY_DN6684_c0_g1~~TRINITY_DN6684_c0_g1_i1.p1  ORF type:complete len:541 (-),score=88.99 TRINITY_DN6684_c0_g1_i1:345-1967(-)